MVGITGVLVIDGLYNISVDWSMGGMEKVWNILKYSVGVLYSIRLHTSYILRTYCDTRDGFIPDCLTIPTYITVNSQ